MPYALPRPIFIVGRGVSKLLVPYEARSLKKNSPLLWVLTDACVALVACPVCEAPVMMFCQFASRRLYVTTHAARRTAARGMLPRGNVDVARCAEFVDETEEHW